MTLHIHQRIVSQLPSSPRERHQIKMFVVACRVVVSNISVLAAEEAPRSTPAATASNFFRGQAPVTAYKNSTCPFDVPHPHFYSFHLRARPFRPERLSNHFLCMPVRTRSIIIIIHARDWSCCCSALLHCWRLAHKSQTICELTRGSRCIAAMPRQLLMWPRHSWT